MKRVSEKQRQIYEYIRSISAERGYPPSIREIGGAVGLSSPSTVQSHIEKLIASGLIIRDTGKTRTLKVAGIPQTTNIPLLGTVTAGQPILAIESIEGYVPYFAEHLDGEYFALRVRGDSMINAGIQSGDTVVVRRQETALHGQIVVALIGEEATIKRLSLSDRSAPMLMPENPAYEPIDGSEATILGRVVALMRVY